MRVIAKKTLTDYGEQQPDAYGALLAWYEHARRAQWTTPADVKQDYASASILPDSYVVFNIKGNQFRLVVRIQYNTRTVYIRFIGTHKQYDAINVSQS